MMSKAMIAIVAIVGVMNVAVVGAEPRAVSNNIRGAPDQSAEVCVGVLDRTTMQGNIKLYV